MYQSWFLSHGNLVKRQVMIQGIWGGAAESTFLTSSQVEPMLQDTDAEQQSGRVWSWLHLLKLHPLPVSHTWNAQYYPSLVTVT